MGMVPERCYGRSLIVWIMALRMVFGAAAQSVPAHPSPTAQPVFEWERAAGGKQEFEVASIHRAAADAEVRHNLDLSAEDLMAPSGGRFSATGLLGMYIQFAYKLSVYQDQTAFGRLPRWATAEVFDIEAKASDAGATKDQMRLMMQSLLADRFKLAVHFETREMPVMALVQVRPGRLGPRLKPHAQGPACDAKIPPVDHGSTKIPDVWMPVCGSTQMLDWADKTVILGSRNTTMDMFTNWISLVEQVDRPVVNQTGLTDRFDIEANFKPPWLPHSEEETGLQAETGGQTFLEALKDQLGLKLVSTRAPIQTLVIDHVEQPSAN